MKRLIKKMANEIPQVDKQLMDKIRSEVREDIYNKNQTNMIELNELNEAEVRHGRCPKCKGGQLVSKDGFKVCVECESIYKIFDGKTYFVKG